MPETVGFRQDHPRIQCHHTFLVNPERVYFDGFQFGMRGRHARQGGQGGRGAFQVERNAAARPFQERPAPQTAQHREGVRRVYRGQIQGDVVQHFGVDTAEAHHRDGAEARILTDAHKKLHTPVGGLGLHRHRSFPETLPEVPERSPHRLGIVKSQDDAAGV